jgi:hypothetical protein
LKDLQAVILAAVLLLPVAQGAGEKDVVSPLNDVHWSAAHTLNFKTPTGFRATSKPGELELATSVLGPFGKRTKRHANCSLLLWRA